MLRCSDLSAYQSAVGSLISCPNSPYSQPESQPGGTSLPPRQAALRLLLSGPSTFKRPESTYHQLHIQTMLPFPRCKCPRARRGCRRCLCEVDERSATSLGRWRCDAQSLLVLRAVPPTAGSKRFTPNGAFLSFRAALRSWICSRKNAGLYPTPPMTPRPPALVTAAASSGPAAAE